MMKARKGQNCSKFVDNNNSLDPNKGANGLYALKIIFTLSNSESEGLGLGRSPTLTQAEPASL